MARSFTASLYSAGDTIEKIIRPVWRPFTSVQPTPKVKPAPGSAAELVWGKAGKFGEARELPGAMVQNFDTDPERANNAEGSELGPKRSVDKRTYRVEKTIQVTRTVGKPGTGGKWSTSISYSSEIDFANDPGGHKTWAVTHNLPYNSFIVRSLFDTEAAARGWLNAGTGIQGDPEQTYPPGSSFDPPNGAGQGHWIRQSSSGPTFVPGGSQDTETINENKVIWVEVDLEQITGITFDIPNMPYKPATSKEVLSDAADGIIDLDDQDMSGRREAFMQFNFKPAKPPVLVRR